MKRGYVVMKCRRCGSTAQIDIASMRDGIPLCPVCSEGEMERQTARIHVLAKYLTSPENYSPN